MPGMLRTLDFTRFVHPRVGEFVFISAASGAVGELVGQFAKLMGCCVVGSAGSNDKVDLLKNKLGFDEAFNYKEEPDFDVALKSSGYQKLDEQGKEFGMEGFRVRDYHHLYSKFLETIIPQIKEGKIVHLEDTVEGLENAPTALAGLLIDKNVG
ncbi:hypothetical protein Patl1_26849 [Pistacia atlantica]|uniref:Uncharacterized protein n=1 Tax=Pistacia atlantica TaxID=434234 RepID=A0ACC1B3I0_9ROSI|nr:hypothetical protein Patl1_26849 [Pistacia atlantica]